MALSPRLTRATAVASSAALCLVCAPPYDFWPAAPVAWSPLIVTISRAPLRRAAALGLLHGVLVNLGALYWVYPPLRTVAGLSVWQASGLFLLLIVVQASRSVLAALLTAAGTARGWPLLLVFPLSLVASERVCPVLFPWHTAILTQGVPAWMQLADVGGPLLLSAWLGLVSAGFAQAWLGRRRGFFPSFVAAAPSLVVLSLVTVAGKWKIASIDAWVARTETARIGVVQGNVGANGRTRRDPVAVYRDLSLELLGRHPNLELLVWPETAVDYPTPSDRLSELFRNVLLRDRRQGVDAKRIDVPLVTGMVVARKRAREPAELTNSAVLADGSGSVLGVYDKQSLVPLGERSLSDFVPLFGRRLPPVSNFAAGGAAGPLELARRRLGISICYEDILDRQFLESVRGTNPELLVNLTSDRWFAGSPGPKLHLAMARLRAVEHRKYLLRATASGVSALIGPTGRTEWQLAEGRATSGVVSVHWLDHPTLYQNWGDEPWLLALIAGVVMAFVPRPGVLPDPET